MILRMYNNSKNKIFKILLGIVLFVGILLRFWIFAQNYCLYADEVGLYNNIKNFNFLTVTLNLQDLQVAPLLFMFISKVFFLLTDSQYIGMKIFPLISSVLSVPAFYFLSKKFLNNRCSVLFANILFCFNFSLIFYSQSIKHYSTEVLITILVLLMFFSNTFENLNYKKAFIFGCLNSFLLCFSFAYMHILTGFYLCFLLMRNINFTKKLKYCLVSIIPLGIILFIHFLIFKNIYIEQVSEFKMLKYFNPYSFEWFMNYFFLDFHNKFLPIILSITFVIGCFLLSKENINKFFILVFSIIAAFLAGKFYIYPFFGRLTLFLFPIFFIVFAKILDYLNSENIALKIFVSVLAILILFQGKVFFINKKLPYLIGTAKEFYQALYENKIKNGEYLFINDQSYDAFCLYGREDFDIEKIVTKKNMLIFYHDTINPFDVVIFPKGSVIHIFAAHYLWVDESYYKSINSWIEESCQILAKKDFKTGTYYKCLNK